MFRSFKMNYNILAAVLGAALVAVFCIVELTFPFSKASPVGTTPQTASGENGIRLPVAMYHHILTKESRLNDYTISPAEFERDLQYIQACGYTPISAQELLDWAENGTALPEKPMMITFDDGYESFHEYAYPLLQKYQMKAIVSIIGKHTDTFSESQDYKSINWSHLTWEQCREMQASGLVEVENHTYNLHDNISGKRYGIRIQKGESEAEYQLAIEKDVGTLSQELQRELGTVPIVFAYPFGALCKESKPVLENLGFKIILTCEEKVNVLTEGNDGPLVLRRFNRAHHYGTEEFYGKLGITMPQQGKQSSQPK